MLIKASSGFGRTGVLAAQWIAFSLCFLFGGGAFGGVVALLKTTDITGAQTFLNKNNGYQWTFTTNDTQSFQEIQGRFTLKLGPNTTADAVVKLYDASGTLLGSSILQASQATQSYVDYTFSLILDNGDEAPYSPEFQFSNGPNYYLAMTSEADNTGSKTWFIKPGSLTFEVLNATQTAQGSYDGTSFPAGAPSAVPPVPEPTSLLVWSLACLGFARSAKRRSGLKTA
jgi:hypothetical protein